MDIHEPNDGANTVSLEDIPGDVVAHENETESESESEPEAEDQEGNETETETKHEEEEETDTDCRNSVPSHLKSRMTAVLRQDQSNTENS
jgi:hypothetical protein